MRDQRKIKTERTIALDHLDVGSLPPTPPPNVPPTVPPNVPPTLPPTLTQPYSLIPTPTILDLEKSDPSW